MSPPLIPPVVNPSVRERPRVEQTQKQEPQSQQKEGTGVHQPVLPNRRREDAGEQGGQRGGQGSQGGERGDPHDLARSLRNGGPTAVVRAVGRLSTGPEGPSPGKDHVFANLGANGVHTFALGSLLPRKYLRLFYKQNMGKNLRVARWLDGDESEAGEDTQRAAITAEEYEQIVREMTLARLNRPMNRLLLAAGGYDDV
ncbi:MAG: hypothetical protein IT384_19295 [Deltaproteobacteria bacterium]|nr:hypothetical protein [Deltaproteobacteria bacterium]